MGVWQRMEFGNGWSLATDGVWQRMEFGNGWSLELRVFLPLSPSPHLPIPPSPHPPISPSFPLPLLTVPKR